MAAIVWKKCDYYLLEYYDNCKIGCFNIWVLGKRKNIISQTPESTAFIDSLGPIRYRF